jgi:hypothetical protein
MTSPGEDPAGPAPSAAANLASEPRAPPSGTSPWLNPVTFGEGRRFVLWDLISLTEGALGTCVAPDSLTVSGEKHVRRGLRKEVLIAVDT